MAYPLVIFDLGGVVVELDSDRLIHQVSRLVGHPFEDVQEVVYHQELLLPLELGRISPQEYYEGLKGKLQLPWTYDQFVRSWNDTLSENTEVTGIIQRLHQHHKLTVLTNTNALHLHYIKTQFPSLSVFHDWVASCEVGLRKPDSEIYRLAVGRADVHPNAVLYIDDRPELVEAGRAAGLTAIRFESGRQLENELRSLGLSV